MKAEHNNGVLVLTPEEAITVQTTAKLVKELGSYLEDPSYDELELNLQKITIVDSRGIGVIVGLFKSLRERERGFKVTGLTQDLHQLFHMMRLDELFAVRIQGR